MEPMSYMEGVPTEEHNGPLRTVIPWQGTMELTNRIYLDEPEGAVLGANAMFGYDILFDVQNKRIGLAKADCGSELLPPTSSVYHHKSATMQATASSTTATIESSNRI